MKDLISIVIPAYNTESYILKAVQSILDQTYANIEVVITDDCSTDRTFQILQTINDNRIKLYRNEKNSGVSFTLNNCILKSNGDLIAVMHADDIAHPDRIKFQADFLRSNNEIAVIGSQCESIDESGRFLNIINVYTNAYDLLLAVFLKKIPFPHPSVMYRKAAVLKVGLYNSAYDGMEDHDMWLKLAAAGYKFGNIPTSLLKYRKHSTQISQNYSATDIVKNFTIFNDFIQGLGIKRDYEEVVKYCNICNNSFITKSSQELKFFLDFFSDILNSQKSLTDSEKKLIKRGLLKKVSKYKSKKRFKSYLELFQILKWVYA